MSAMLRYLRARGTIVFALAVMLFPLSGPWHHHEASGTSSGACVACAIHQAPMATDGTGVVAPSPPLGCEAIEVRHVRVPRGSAPLTRSARAPPALFVVTV